jgi:hypothetical protein
MSGNEAITSNRMKDDESLALAHGHFGCVGAVERVPGLKWAVVLVDVELLFSCRWMCTFHEVSLVSGADLVSMVDHFLETCLASCETTPLACTMEI